MLRISALATIAALTFLGGSNAAEPNPYEFLNSRYVLDHPLTEGNGVFLSGSTIFFTNFRINGSGAVRGRADVNRFTQTDGITEFRGRVVVNRNGDKTRAKVVARGGAIRVVLRLRNRSQRPEIVSGTGVVRTEGLTFKIKAGNNRRTGQFVFPN